MVGCIAAVAVPDQAVAREIDVCRELLRRDDPTAVAEVLQRLDRLSTSLTS
jgi:hypothetical protein